MADEKQINEESAPRKAFNLGSSWTRVAVLSVIVAASVITLGIFSYASTGQFTKVFSKTVSPGQTVESNITVRKYYNLTVRFRYSLNGSDLSFSDSDAAVTLKDVSGSEVAKLTGITNGKIYATVDRLSLDMVETADATSVSSYEDIANQTVSITLSGTKAYLTVVVAKKQGNATLAGYVIDDLTERAVDGINILAYESNADPNAASAAAQDTSVDGRYSLELVADADGKTYDIYIRDYYTA